MRSARVLAFGATLLASVLLVALPALSAGAQTTLSPFVVMQQGTYYDPAQCASTAQVGGLIFCQPQPTPTPVPVPVGDAIPLCPTHDPLVAHGLYDAVRNCHYDHEHHADPNTVNDLFGLPGAFFGHPGQSISYPWQTFNATTGALENDAKHNGYKWVVKRDLGCDTGGVAPGCITAFRAEMHALSTNSDAVVRFHSFSLEAVGCLNGVCGTIANGGWMDFGALILENPNPPGGLSCPTLASNPPGFVCPNAGSNERLQGAVGRNEYQADWYGSHRTTQVSPFINVFGDIDPNNPNNQLFFPSTPAGAHNGSMMHAHNMLINVSRLPKDAAGLVNFNGYTDRYGNVVSGCTVPALDCVPLVVQHLPSGSYFMLGLPDGTDPNYDTSPARLGTGQAEWIAFPN